MADDPSADPFATAKANLRDTVKWLAAALAGTAAAAVGSSPLTGLGSLKLLSSRFDLGAISLAIALLALLGAIAIILELLVGEIFSLEASSTEEWVQKFVDQRKNDLLPPGFASLSELIAERRRQAQILSDYRDNQADPAYRAAQDAYKRLQPPLGNITSLLLLEQLRRRVRHARIPLALLSIIGAAALILYSWAANPPKPAEEHPSANAHVSQTAP